MNATIKPSKFGVIIGDTGWTPPDRSGGGWSPIIGGGWYPDPILVDVGGGGGIIYTASQTNTTPANPACECLIGTPKLVNGVCTCDNSGAITTTTNNTNGTTNNATSGAVNNATTPQGILDTLKANPLLAVIGAVALIALLRK